ncbi:MAG: hypothetical protein Q4F57_04275 [Weeksellaceae bacterium]|nr:hypothetical protein [Weeksellaceae bacterium]
MKNLIYISIFLFSAHCVAQVAIGKNAVTNSSVSLEFAEGPKGLLLPYVETPTGVTEQGTLYVDATNGRVKLRLADGTFDYSSRDPQDATHDGTLDLTPQQVPGLQAAEDGKSIIGAEDSAVNGILILESDQQAMILPKLSNPEINIDSPSAGMIVYDAVRKILCVYNGTEWSYWAAGVQ